MSRNIKVVFTFLIVIGLVFMGTTVSAQEKDVKKGSKDTLKNKDDLTYEKVIKIQKSIGKELSGTEKDLLKLKDGITEIELEIEDLETVYTNNKKETKKVKKEIKKVTEDIKDLEKKLDKREGILKERLQAYQKTGDIEYLEVIFGSKSFSDFIGRVDAITRVLESDKEIIRDQEKDKKHVNKQLEDLVELENELGIMTDNIEDQKKQSKEKKKKLLKEEKELKEKMEELRLKESDLLGLGLTKEDVKATGDLAMPVKTGYISSPFSKRVHPITGKISFHKGIDVARTDRSKKPAIYASDSGTVVHSGYNTGGYGNMVKIRHDNGVETLYAHMSSLDVKTGQKVLKGEKLGIMGTTGRSTGIHLHFEVIVDGKHQNPMRFLNEEKLK